jgi:hypothetical protein
MTFLNRQLQQETDFDASQGRCCCTWGNRRGTRLVLWVDQICFFYIPRFVLAVLAFRDERKFAMYAKVRRVTFFINVLACLGGVLTYIILDVLQNGGKNYLYILAMLVLSVVVLIWDYHFTHVVVFYMRHPPQGKAAINWLMSDSEP